MRRAARTDLNQSAIVAALRKLGASVQPIHQLGGGVPDLLVATGVPPHGRSLVLEIKDGSKPPSARGLTEDEERWQSGWRGEVHTVCSQAEAIAVVFGRRAL